MLLQNKTNRKVRLVSPYPITHRFSVQDEFIGKTLAEMMTIRFPFRSKNEWKQRIEQKRVGINDEPVTPNYILKKENTVFHHNPNVIEPSVPNEVEILEETKKWIAVFKPAPLPMHPGGRYYKNTLTAILEEMGHKDLKIIHRLDAVTSGIVLFSKTKEFAQKAMTEFSEGRVLKTYIAEVSGIPDENSITITAPIKRKNGFVFESRNGLENAKPAETIFTVLERKKSSAIIQCEPKTGRTHQIRLHLEYWGHPVIDDPIYGLKGNKTSKKAQNVGISLVSTELIIERLGVNMKIPAKIHTPHGSMNPRYKKNLRMT